jgi:hypothetical protein
MRLVIQALNGPDISVNATIYQELGSLSFEVLNFLKTAECVEKQKVFVIVIMGQSLDLPYEVNGGLQTLRDHLLCHPYFMKINMSLGLSKARRGSLSNIISKKSQQYSLVSKNGMRTI